MAHRPPFRTVLAAGALASSALIVGLPFPAGGTDGPLVAMHATVLARALLDAQRAPQSIVISQEDIARGYHDVQEPMEIDFRSNVPGGVVLALATNSAYFEAVEAQASEGGMPLSAGSAVFVPQRERGLRARSVSLKLRLKLAPGAVAGPIAFPVTVSLSPA